MGRFQVQVVSVYLNGGTITVGPPPNPLIEGCYLVQRSVIIFFDFLILLVFELGEGGFAFRIHAYSLNSITVVVVLTVKNGYRDCTPPQLLVRLRYSSFPVLVNSGTPLLRVIYRDSKPLFSR